MRALIVALLITAQVFAQALGYAAEDPIDPMSPQKPRCFNTTGTGVMVCIGSDGNVITTSGPASSSARNTSGSSGIQYAPYNRLTTDANGQGCVTTGYTPVGVTPPDGAPAPDDPSYQGSGAGGYNNVFNDYPPCPEQPRAPGQPAPVETRAMVAARYWERIPLPKPRPSIAPGRAITGKLAYLETRGETTHTYTNDTVFGPLVIVASGSYLVDWGDGEKSGPHAYEGKPWPEGQITHEYQKIGAYDVVVTERWTARWSLGGESGVLRTLQTTGRIDDFPVQQIQAVVR